MVGAFNLDERLGRLELGVRRRRSRGQRATVVQALDEGDRHRRCVDGHDGGRGGRLAEEVRGVERRGLELGRPHVPGGAEAGGADAADDVERDSPTQGVARDAEPAPIDQAEESTPLSDCFSARTA